MMIHSVCSRRTIGVVSRKSLGGIWPGSCRWYSTDLVKENDIVLLKHRSSGSPPIITGQLVPNGVERLVGDSIKHINILGRSYREVTISRRGTLYRIHRPTLAEYTDNSPRIVTPIYSQDASLIVSLLDLHPTLPPTKLPMTSEDNERIEIFEAGTGHGALTLHLARAIHAANTSPPQFDTPHHGVSSAVSSTQLASEGTKVNDTTTSDIEEVDSIVEDNSAMKRVIAQQEAALEEWRSSRRAIIHTLDSSKVHSDHARMVVKNFRRGIYYPHIDFHVGSINEYLTSRLSENGDQPFLSHAILDLPSTHEYIDIVAKALKPTGSLLVFCPSVTQIINCAKVVKEKEIPLFLDKTIEVGNGAGVGGREWDIRAVKPRAILKAEALEVNGTSSDEGWETICRPKVGLRTSGGGFVGQFQKIVEFTHRVVKVGGEHIEDN